MTEKDIVKILLMLHNGCRNASSCRECNYRSTHTKDKISYSICYGSADSDVEIEDIEKIAHAIYLDYIEEQING
jgi:hypothetical protein